jgi:hypothetical protein
LLKRLALFRRSAACLDDEEISRYATAARRVGAVLDRHVVVDDDRRDLDALGLGRFARHVPAHAVALVIIDKVQHALGRIHQPRALEHIIHRWRGEDATRTSRVEHALAHDHDVRRLVAAAGALDDGNLVRVRRIGAVNDVVLR